MQGITPLLIMFTTVSTILWRTPEKPLQSVLAREQHRGTDGVLREGLAGAGGVAVDDSAAEFGALLGRDANAGELTDAGRNAVDRAILGDTAFEHGA